MPILGFQFQQGGVGMIRTWASAIAGLSVLLLAGSARSSGCCDETPRWKLANALFTGYDNSVVAVPGNDTRVNLVLLLADRHGGDALAAPAPPGEKSTEAGLTPLFQWPSFRTTATDTENSGSMVSGSRCGSNAAGTQAFEAALSADGKVPAAEKTALMALRRAMKPDCDNGEGNLPVDAATAGLSDAAKPFALYLQGAQAFYAGNFDTAAMRFATLGSAKNAWLKETALYMVARSAVNRAQIGAFDDYGTLAEPGKRDTAAASAAEKGLTGYLRSYPQGAYAVSARGLMRRVYWLAGDRRKLADEYRKLFAIRDPAQRGIDDFTLAEELDQKLLPGLTTAETGDPTLLAVSDLMRMRGKGDEYATYGNEKPITLAEIEAQQASFASDKPLYDFVRASFAFYVANRPADVLAIIPDAARQPRFASVQFSRQMLRGFALEAKRDPNARGFWLEMIGGATQRYQRQAVEMALAMHEERNGGLARVFAPDSPIRDTSIRGILLTYGAGPDILRQQASSAKVPKVERDAALFTLLTKQLGRGMYAGFLGDLRLVRPGTPAASGDFSAVSFRGVDYGEPREAPLGLFTAPGGYGDFACPSLRDVAGLLAKNPRAPKPLICVAEFFRVSGFDHFALDAALPRDELGGAPSLFPGKPFSRLEIYKAVIADPAARPDDKAYALYRAVNCYAPGGTNDCGGVDVGKAQRQAWFLRLSNDYPQTSWAKSSRYYW
jgi:hypothetical protein